MVIVTATGTLKPTNNEVSVGSELSGIVKTVEVDYNSKVKVGQILARLDTSKLETQIMQYKASLEAAQAKAALATYETDISKSIIRSPINGVALTRSVEPGQTVAAAMTAPTLFTLAADLTKMELHVNVDEADVSRIQEGQKASFSVAAWPNRTPGISSAKRPAMNATTGSRGAWVAT